MNDCTRLDEQLPAYLDGSLGEIESERLEIHAASCDRCHEFMEQSTRLPAAWPLEIAAPVTVRASVLNAIATRNKRTSYRWPLVAAAAAILIAVGVMKPPQKSAQVPAGDPTAQLVSQRAEGEFKKLAVARAEIMAELDKRPDDVHLLAVLANLEERQRDLDQLVRKFQT